MTIKPLIAKGAGCTMYILLSVCLISYITRMTYLPTFCNTKKISTSFSLVECVN